MTPLCRVRVPHRAQTTERAGARMPRIFVLDEHSVYRIGLCNLLRTELPRAKMINASNLNDALSQLRNGGFDLVLAGTDRSVDLKWLAEIGIAAARIALREQEALDT